MAKLAPRGPLARLAILAALFGGACGGADSSADAPRPPALEGSQPTEGVRQRGSLGERPALRSEVPSRERVLLAFRGLQLRPVKALPPEVRAGLEELEARLLDGWQRRRRDEGRPTDVVAPGVPGKYFVTQLDPGRELWIASYRSAEYAYDHAYLVRDAQEGRVGKRLDFGHRPWCVATLVDGTFRAVPARSSAVELVDLNRDGREEIALFEWDHNGTVWNATTSLVYEVDEDLSLQPVVKLRQSVNDFPTDGELVTTIEALADGLLVRLFREHRDPELVGEVAWQFLTRPDRNATYTVASFASTDRVHEYEFLVDKL